MSEIDKIINHDIFLGNVCAIVNACPDRLGPVRHAVKVEAANYHDVEAEAHVYLDRGLVLGQNQCYYVGLVENQEEVD